MYKNLKTSDPNIDVHITYRQVKCGSLITLRGYAIKSMTGVRVDGSKTLVRTASCPESIPTAEQHLLSAVMSALPRISSDRASAAKEAHPLQDDNTIVHTFSKLKELNDPITPNWRGSTRQRHLMYFERNILPYLQSYEAEEFLPEDLEHLRQILINKVLGSGKSKGAIRNTETTVQANLAAASTIYRRMRELGPSLPDIDWGEPVSIKRVMTEQIKAIPEYYRQKFYAKLKESISQSPEMVHAAVLMVDGGLRTAEAAAICPQDVVTYIDGHAIIPVLWQADKQNQRTPILKTDAAYRQVPLSIWGTTMLQRCSSRIEADEERAILVAPNRLSAWILNMMRACGMQDHLDAARTAQAEGPEGRQATYDLAAYVWRRDRVDRWRNICGMTCDPYDDSEIDHLLGHRTPSARRKVDYRSKEALSAIAQKLERYVYDKAISGAPQISPLPIVHGTDISLTPYRSIRLRNNGEGPVSVRLDIESLENAEYIIIKHPEGQKVKSTTRWLDSQGKRPNRPVICGNELDEEGGDPNEG